MPNVANVVADGNRLSACRAVWCIALNRSPLIVYLIVLALVLGVAR